MIVHLHDFGPRDWWTRCGRRLHPSRATANLAEVTCKVCLARA